MVAAKSAWLDTVSAAVAASSINTARSALAKTVSEAVAASSIAPFMLIAEWISP